MQDEGINTKVTPFSSDHLADVLWAPLKTVRDLMMDLDNAVEQDDRLESWDEVGSVVTDLEYAVTQLGTAIDVQFQRRDVEVHGEVREEQG